MPIRKALITRICKKKLNTKNQEGLNRSQEVNYTQASMFQHEDHSLVSPISKESRKKFVRSTDSLHITQISLHSIPKIRGSSVFKHAVVLISNLKFLKHTDSSVYGLKLYSKTWYGQQQCWCMYLNNN